MRTEFHKERLSATMYDVAQLKIVDRDIKNILNVHYIIKTQINV